MYERVADLPLTIEEWDLVRRERETSSGFERVTTTVVLRGAGEAGRGEDVTYETADQEAFLSRFDADLAGEYTLDSFSRALDGIDPWPEPPSREDFRQYRRWAFEAAALDLALRQAETNLGAVLDREYDPVRFVVSTRLPEPDGEAPSADRVEEWLDVNPSLEFKLDPTPAWDDDLVATLVATDAVRVVDLKGHYEDTEVETSVDPTFYRRICEGFPEAVVEDPGVTPATRPLLAHHEPRISWDAPIHDLASVRSIPMGGRWLNCKPSRFGTLRSVLATIRFCELAGLTLYGGGQFELGPGRGQLHELASLFYPDAPNDVAPREYNEPEPREGLRTSPLAPPEDHVGFGWGE